MSSFEITHHYEVFSDDEEATFKIREVEVVVKEGKVYRWNAREGVLHLLPCEHVKTSAEALEAWRDRLRELCDSYRRAVVVLEKKLELTAESIQVVKKNA